MQANEAFYDTAGFCAPVDVIAERDERVLDANSYGSQ